MSESGEQKDYYDEFKGPDIYRVSLKQEGSFAYELPNGTLRAELLSLSTLKERAITLDNQTSGWLYTYNGNGFLKGKEDFEAGVEDLFYLRPNGSVTLTSDEEMKALLITMTNTSATEISPSDKPRVTKLPRRSEKPVDWVGNWLPEIDDALLHVAREGTSSLAADNPPAEVPLHEHEQTIEVYFTAAGRSIMNLERDGKLERLPMRAGDLCVTTPRVFHGAGSTTVDKTYSGDPYRGVVFKIPADASPVQSGDKFFQTTVSAED